MKKYFLTLIPLFIVIVSRAQDPNIISSLNGPAYGVKIKANFPGLNGGYARGFMISNENASVDFFGLGVMGNIANGASSMTYAYLGSGFNTAKMVFLPNGNVGIGTTNPTAKLAVNGNIRAKEIKVETSLWPDYVFAKSYQLQSLEETERYIKDRGHLPEIPSAKEVETNGIDLGEMNAKLLKKIEEMTLHLIEKDKEIKQLNQLNGKVKALELKLEELFNKQLK